MLSSRLSRPLAQPSAAAWASMRALHATPRNRKVHEIKWRVFPAEARHDGSDGLQPEDFRSTVKDKPKVIVNCSAVWCGPCKTITPVLENLSEEPRFRDKVHFFKFDIDEVPEVAQELGVRALPTFITFENSLKAGQIVGADPRKLESMVKELADA